MLHVGYTKYGNDGEFIEKSAITPWGGSYARYICPKYSFQPFNFDIEELGKNWFKFENILRELVPNYLGLRKELKLDKVLSKYWASQDMPIGTNLPTLSSALETLMEQWYKSKGSKSKGMCIPENEFKDLCLAIDSEITSIENKIIAFKKENEKRTGSNAYDTKNFDVLQNKMDKCIKELNNIPPSKKFEIFCEEIELKISPIERKAIKERHKMAHVGEIKNRDQFRKVVKCTYVYLTLFHRVFLKILDFKGRYVDLFTKGLPERHIDVPVGGNNSPSENEIQ